MKQRRRGREATTAAILEAAAELFSAHGYSAVSVRDIAERAGVTHPVVHRYVGAKAGILRAVLARNEGLIAAAAPAQPDLLDSAGGMLREALTPHGRTYIRLVADPRSTACPTSARPAGSRRPSASSSWLSTRPRRPRRCDRVAHGPLRAAKPGPLR